MSLPKDVPIARRVSQMPPQKKRSFRRIVILGIISLAIALLTYFLITLITPTKNPSNPIAQTPKPETNIQSITPPIIQATPAIISATQKLLGHLAYKEAPLNSLETIAIATDGYQIKLRAAAAQKYKQMIADAQASNVDLMAISGFRSKEEQSQLFFEISRQRNQTAAQRAKVSAPSGYSEHHTGYAVDIGDRNAPSSILSPSFDRTDGFRWLQQNASKYSFELSFPQNNPQGVMYEPWHWRFVGDDDSLATFYKKTR